MEDEEECDGIEVPLSDNKGEPQTNRHRISLWAFKGGLGKISVFLTNQVKIWRKNKANYLQWTIR